MNDNVQLFIEGDEVEPVTSDQVEVSFTGPDPCKERIYSFDDPCAGPHHICDEFGDHSEHECFCGFTWTDEDANKALELSRKEWRMLNRAELKPEDIADKEGVDA